MGAKSERNGGILLYWYCCSHSCTVFMFSVCLAIAFAIDVPMQYVGIAKSERRALEEEHRKSEEQRKGRCVSRICCEVQREEARAGR